MTGRVRSSAPGARTCSANLMQLYPSGKLVDPLNLRPEDVELRDIAHSLSLINRYGGHTPWPYSVAQHSLHVAAHLEQQSFNARFQLLGLLHDAAEAYLGDVIAPLKKRLFVSQAPSSFGIRLDGHEDLAMIGILHALVPGLEFDNHSAEVIHAADMAVMRAECDTFGIPMPEGLGDVAPANVRIYPGDANTRGYFAWRFADQFALLLLGGCGGAG